MAAYLDANKRKTPLVIDDEVVEVAANGAPANEAAAAVQPSSGTAAKKRQASLQFMAVGNKTKPEGKANKCVVEMLRKTPEEIVDERLSGSYQPTIVSSTKTKEEKHYVDTQWRGRHLINFLVNSPEGTYFLESIDASSEVHDAYMLAGLLEKKVEEIGKDKVVQVVTDNGANFKDAGKILMDRIPTIFWTSMCCALLGSHKPITRARRVTTFIYRHGRILSAMREKTGGVDLVRPAATRFAMAFLTLKSLYKHKDALKSLMLIGGVPMVAVLLNYKDLQGVWLVFVLPHLAVHTKKRNRLLHKRMNSIVFVSYNRKMKSRFQKLRQKKGKNFDPLVIEDFDWNNEWADSLHVPPQAVGASQSLQGRNFPRAAHKRARNSAPTVNEDELGSDNEENPDPFDDADVTDCEDDPNDANETGEDNEAANIPGEFDDGY
ncbi:unnamed protein product [Miscanthus lutarioriparius]|uniref:DUF659 domain-containing protein n=1 Tax=Miscanthus lutarioriparius TaxID=422564 RepID=A0A811P632_9POAL|nr:unnamed protein product [Miscanthus lutarioriparius]